MGQSAQSASGITSVPASGKFKSDFDLGVTGRYEGFSADYSLFRRFVRICRVAYRENCSSVWPKIIRARFC